MSRADCFSRLVRRNKCRMKTQLVSAPQSSIGMKLGRPPAGLELFRRKGEAMSEIMSNAAAARLKGRARRLGRDNNAPVFRKGKVSSGGGLLLSAGCRICRYNNLSACRRVLGCALNGCEFSHLSGCSARGDWRALQGTCRRCVARLRTKPVCGVKSVWAARWPPLTSQSKARQAAEAN